MVLIVILTVLLIFVCVALIGLILIQQGKGGGLVAFGSGGVEQAFGTHAATLAQKATAVLAVMFLALSVVLGLLHQKAGGSGSAAAPAPTSESESAPASAPAETPAPPLEGE